MRRTSLNHVHELAKQDERVIFVGSDLGAGTLDAMRQEMPERFFMEGIAEQNLIGVAAGLALEGFIPYVNTIATFLTRRCLEQLAIDVCLHKLPLRLIGNGGGMVYAPLGPTHTTLEDMALMQALPNMGLLAPCDAHEMQQLMPQTLAWQGPLYIRLAKGGDAVVSDQVEAPTLGRARLFRQGDDLLLLSTGILTQRALAAAELLAGDGLNAAVLHLPMVSPLDEAAILQQLSGKKALITLEEHSVRGGLGTAVSHLLLEQGALQGSDAPRFKMLGFPHAWSEGYGSQNEHLSRAGLDPEAIHQSILSLLEER
uniref:Putative transketolase C-terminal section. Putative 1-deoxy-D-xylulose-5-phosphate synthase n=1 Tax=Magnetococcus massalia (strain MO-1) TaxID=451514 RepID=A0A1S7LEB2_MAGMO|nr:Putative transketolase C-terminal section. Putative 1-deoxy-D-xylulose-5-phosphate synthase [Candidatus Magnetococcus massalia]